MPHQRRSRSVGQLRRYEQPSVEEKKKKNESSSVAADIECEPPNHHLGRFEGNLSWKGEKWMLKSENLLLRGAKLKNTRWICGGRGEERRISSSMAHLRAFSRLLCRSRHETDEEQRQSTVQTNEDRPSPQPQHPRRKRHTLSSLIQIVRFRSSSSSL